MVLLLPAAWIGGYTFLRSYRTKNLYAKEEQSGRSENSKRQHCQSATAHCCACDYPCVSQGTQRYKGIS